MIRVSEDSGDRRMRADWRPDPTQPQQPVAKLGFTDHKAAERFNRDLQNAINAKQDEKRDQVHRPASYYDPRG